MAAYFWVGGAGDLGDGTHWSLASGGAPAGVVPGTADDVTFNTLSGTNFLVTGAGSYRSFTSGAGATPQFEGISVSTIDGNLTLSAATTFVNSSTSFTTSNITLSNYTVNLGNAPLAGLVYININAGLGSTVTVSGTINNAGQVLLAADAGCTLNLGATVMTVSPGIWSGGVTFAPQITGILNCNTASITAYAINLCDNSGVVNLNSSTCIATQQLIDNSLSSGGTINAGTSTLRLLSSVTDPALGGVPSFIPKLDGLGSYNIVQFQGNVNYIQTSFTCATMTVTTNANNYGTLIIGTANITVSGTLTLTGNSATNRLYVYSANPSFSPTITATTKSLTNVDFSDITAAGTAWTGTSLGNCLGNTNITFTTPVTRYAVAAGNWNSTAVWSATSGGAAGATVPLPQDTVILNAQSGIGTIATNTVRVLGKNVSVLSGYNGTFSINTSAATTAIRQACFVYGDFFIGTSCTLLTTDTAVIVGGDTASTLNITTKGFTTANNSAIYIAPRTSITVSLTGDLNNSSNNMYLASGAIDTAGYNITCSYLYSTPNLPLSGWVSSTGFTYGTSYLRSSTVTVYSLYIDGITDAGTSTVILGTSGEGGICSASNFNNVYIYNTVAGAGTYLGQNNGFQIVGAINNLSSNTFPYISTYGFNIVSSPITINSSLNIGSLQAPVIFTDSTIYNNTPFTPLETSYAYYFKCTATGSGGINYLRAFGAANMGLNTGITFPNITKTYAFSNTTTSTFTVPSDFTNNAYLVAIGSGGNGARAGGGSGGISLVPFLGNISSLSPGNTISISSTQQGNNVSATISGVTKIQANRGTNAVTTTRGAGATLTSAVGARLFLGSSGGFSNDAGGGGAAPFLNGLSTGGNGGINLSGGAGGGGGGGLNSNGLNGGSANGGNGGSPGGTGGTGTPTSSAGGNATSGSGGGGGGGGGGTYTTATVSGTYSRVATTATLTINITSHGMTNGQSGTFTFTSTQTGTYSRTGTLVTCTRTSHGLSTGQVIYFDATSGTAADGYYTVTNTGANTFTFNTVASGSTSGNFTIRVQPATATAYTVTVVNANQLTITTTSTAVMAGSVSVTYVSANLDGATGGLGASTDTYSYNYLNNVLTSGTIGPGGGGGGGGSARTAGAGGNGGNGAIGAGGGGTGNAITGSPTAGTGGSGLIIITYALAIPPAQASIVG
jgi:hypothetical protein